MIKIVFHADNDVTPGAKAVNAAMVTENADLYCFVGDGPYSDSGTVWVSQQKQHFDDKKAKMMWSRGNHDEDESESKQTQEDMEEWFPEAKGVGITDCWLSSRQVGNVYIISMDTQDLDVEFKRDQFNWVTAELAKAKQLRASGQIDWVVCMCHKPWFTLKTSHSPYTAVRFLYKDLFRDEVDFMVHGHNHNTQLWKPMIPNQSEANGEGEQLFTMMPDGKTFDFSKDHGTAYIVTGHSGHEWNSISDSGGGVANVLHYRDDGEYGYTLIEFDGKKATVFSKDIGNGVTFQYPVSREGGIIIPPECTDPAKCKDPQTGECRPIGLNEHKSPTDGSCQQNTPTGCPDGQCKDLTTGLCRPIGPNEVKDGFGVCKPKPQPGGPICPRDYHYDQSLQKCIPDLEPQLNPICPPNTTWNGSVCVGSGPQPGGNIDQQKAIDFIKNSYKQSVQMLEEAPGFNVFWLWNDQLLGQIVLKHVDKTLATTIENKMNSFGVTMKTPWATLDAKYRNNFSVKQATEPTIPSTNPAIRYSDYGGPSDLPVTGFADIAFLSAIHYFYLGDTTKSRQAYDAGKAMWDGQGMKDNGNITGDYAVYKVALGLLAEEITGFPTIGIPADYFKPFQNTSNGGITTDKTNGQPAGSQNVETTAAVLFAVNPALLVPPTTGGEQPVAKLTAPSSVNGGDNVVLDGSQSVADTLSITQTAGQNVSLTDVGTFKKQFTAPTGGNFQLAFQAIAVKGTQQSITQVAIQVTTQGPQPGGDWVLDSNGVGWSPDTTGDTVGIEMSRDEATDDRWSGNVTGLRNGFEATFIGKSMETSGDAHFAMKQFGGNHSGSGASSQRWYDNGLRQDGTVQLQWEQPHPSNHDYELPDTKQFIKKISKGLEGNWIGLKWRCETVTPNGSPANGGVRVRMWVDEDPLDANNKPKNGWKPVLDFIDGVDVQVINPQDYEAPDEQDCEVRRSDTGKHEIYSNGQIVEAQEGVVGLYVRHLS